MLASQQTPSWLAALAAGCLAAASLPQAFAQTDLIPLGDPTDDDGAYTAVFGPLDRYLFVGHLYSGSVTRMDLSTGLVDRSVPAGQSVGAMELTANGQRLVALDGTGSITVLSVPDLVPVGTYPTGDPSATDLNVTVDGLRAVVASQTSITVVDLQNGSIAQQWNVAGFAPYVHGMDRFHLAGDSATLNVLVSANSQVHIESFDIATGAFLSRIVESQLSASDVKHCVQSADRSTMAIASRTPSGTRAYTYDSGPLAQTDQTEFHGSNRPASFELNLDGTRAVVLTHRSVGSFPLDGDDYFPGDANITWFTVPDSAGFPATDLTVSRDGRRVLVGRESEGYFAADITGANSSIVEAPRRRLARGFASRNGSTFALVDTASDRIVVIDATGPGLASLTLEASSGFGQEADGPYSTITLRGPAQGSVGLLTAGRNSDHIARVDVASRSVVGRLQAARGPLVLAQSGNDFVLVGHEDGTVMLIDPSGPTELDRLVLGGAATEVALDPSAAGTAAVRAWVRTEENGQSGLYRIDVSNGNQLSLVTSAMLDVSQGNPRDQLRPHIPGSMAIDWAGQLAYLISAADGEIEVVDLAPSVPTSISSPGTGGQLAGSNSAAQLKLTSDGGALAAFVAGVSPAGPAVYDTSAMTGGPLVERWRIILEQSSTDVAKATSLQFTADGTKLLVDATGSSDLGMPYSPGVVALSMGDGTEAGRFGAEFSDGFDLQADRALVLKSGQIIYGRYDGASFVDIERVGAPYPTVGSPRFIPGTSLAYVHTPLLPLAQLQEGLVMVDLSAGHTQVACEGGPPNATGVQATIELGGSTFAGEELHLTSHGLQPGQMFGMLVVGNQLVAPYPAGSGIGQLCVGGSVGRLTSQVQSANAAGEHVYSLDTGAVGTSAGTFSLQPGETWTFQDWHRDTLPSGAATSNTSTAIAITFR